MFTISLYGGEITLELHPIEHEYFVNGKKVPTVSQIAGAVGPPWSVPEKYGASKAVAYLQDELAPWLDDPCWEFLPHRDGLVPPSTYHIPESVMLAKFEDAKTAARRHTDEKANIGSQVHAFAQDHMEGKEPTYPDHPEAINGVEAYLKWWEEHDIEPIACERILYSRDYGFAGTCDLQCKYEGRLAIIDYKTSPRFYPSWGLQLAGYKVAVEEELCNLGNEFVDFLRISVRFDRNTGKFYTKEYTDGSDWIKFLGSLMAITGRHYD